MKGFNFERWSNAALREPTTRTLWSNLLNLVFPSDAEQTSREQLAAWAKENRIQIRFEPTVTAARRQDYWVHTTHLPPD